MAVTPPASDLVLPRSASISTSTRRAGNGQGRERQCLTASHFDPEPMRGSLAGMPAGISGGQRITSARSCSTIGAMPWPHAMNSAIYARARSRHQHRTRARRPICGALAQHGSCCIDKSAGTSSHYRSSDSGQTTRISATAATRREMQSHTSGSGWHRAPAGLPVYINFSRGGGVSRH